ncbi:phage protease [Metapseudomonas furukawaii]|uniref:phage protease n=1 Tax=Metapseudomonas furukawaii TaxID=1149133 RepID=UPI004045A166
MTNLIALNTDLSASLADGQTEAPDWIELIPAGPGVQGRDGRRWLFDAAAHHLVRAAFAQREIDVPIDWEHATQRRAPKGEEAPAAAWITQLEVRDDGSLWGNVQWTPRGETQVLNREYRYLSPVFDYDSATGRIARLVSAGLANIPNLFLTALNQEDQEVHVRLPKPLLDALGLAADAGEDQAVAAITQLKAIAQAANNEQPSLERFVPRADYDTLLQRATNSEQALAIQRKAEHDKLVDAALEAASAAGKITPATLNYHRAMCSDQAGLERFQAFVAAAPSIGDPSTLGDLKPSTTATALNTEEKAMCLALGVSEHEFLKTKEAGQ